MEDVLNYITRKPQLLSLRKGIIELKASSEEKAEIGGKAQGLLSILNALNEINDEEFNGVNIEIPPMTVLGASVFDAFIQRNNLLELACSNLPDDRITHEFLQADMPFEILGELRKIVTQTGTPLAIRSSGLLEDTTHRPFAGVYQTKMIPNNQYDLNIRFQKLLEAIKFVWASTFFKTAKDYCKATGLCIDSEKMAVIIQEMVGKKYQDRFYPELSGVARSFNYYPVKPAKPADGVVDLALGLGKTIVDGGKSWTYSRAYPQIPPPFESVNELLRETQNEFWYVYMGELLEYNPTQETEYMRKENLVVADKDGTLRYIASTYDPQSERLSIGTGIAGPRAITFAPLLQLKEIPFNRLISTILLKCEEFLGYPVEIEFAMTFDPHRFSYLQVRPMVAPSVDHHVHLEDLSADNTLIASEMVLGNGVLEDIHDIIFAKPEKFELKYTKQVADELEIINHKLVGQNRSYLLVVFGRLGTFDPWLGIPLTWGQICGAKAIVEATQENVKVELSQGSHYFHNIINLGIKYFSMPYTSPHRIDWDWIQKQELIEDMEFIRHVRSTDPLIIKVDGRRSRGVILKK